MFGGGFGNGSKFNTIWFWVNEGMWNLKFKIKRWFWKCFIRNILNSVFGELYLKFCVNKAVGEYVRKSRKCSNDIKIWGTD